MPARKAKVSQTADVNAKTPSQILSEKMAREDKKLRIRRVQILAREGQKLGMTVPDICHKMVLDTHNEILAEPITARFSESQKHAMVEKVLGVESLLDAMRESPKTAYPASMISVVADTLAYLTRKQ